MSKEKKSKKTKHEPERPTNSSALADCHEALEKAMVQLVFNEEFYANLIMNMCRVITTEIPTLGVAPPGTKYSQDEIALIVNPYFFLSMTVPEQIDVLKHECGHVINNHFVRFRDLEPQIYEESEKRDMRKRVEDIMNASTLNQAGDYALNEYLPNLPKKIKCFDKDGKPLLEPNEISDGKGGMKKNPKAGKQIQGEPCFVKTLQKHVPNTQRMMNTEYYYEILKKEQEKQQQNGNGQGNQGNSGGMVLDDHSLWHESDMDEDAITEKVKETVNKAVDQTKSGIGSLPADIQAAIDALNHVPKDWRQDLQRFVARQMEIIIESSRKKRNRRYGTMYPGYRKDPQMHLAVAIDTSGSVSDDELAQFFAEIDRIHKLGVKVTVIECDAEVNGVYDFDPRKPFEVRGRGGTRFKPVFDYIEKEKIEIDGLIYLTDGGCFEDPSELKKPRFPVMWAILKQYNFEWPWGYKTQVEVKRKVSR